MQDLAAIQVIHRDIKPDNIMLLDQGGGVKLLDLGLAFLPGIDAADAAKPGGTIRYMAPELLRGSPASSRTEVYALGVTIYRMFAGGPFPFGQREKLPLARLRPNLPHWLGEVLARALAPKPEDRFADAGELARALQAGLAERQERPMPFVPPFFTPLRLWQGTTLLFAALSLILAAKLLKMTRILYMSDLHLEMERWRLSIPGWQDFLARHRDARKHPLRGPLLTGFNDIDLVILAGDIHTGLRGVVYAEQLAAYFDAPVIYVAGNHEYYRQHMDLLDPALRATATRTGGRVQFLENMVASFTFSGQRVHVLGCTLWTDYRLRGDQEADMAMAARYMIDHRMIHRVSTLFRPEHALTRHERSRAWLRETVARLRLEEPGAKIIAVTHHAPHAALLGRRAGRIAPAYASNLLPDFCAAPPDLWIHGHTHYRHDSVLEGHPCRFCSARLCQP